MNASHYTVVYETENPKRWHWYVGNDTFRSSNSFPDVPQGTKWTSLASAKATMTRNKDLNPQLVTITFGKLASVPCKR